MNSYNNSGLENANWIDSCPFVPNVRHGKVIKVYDGDSITIASNFLNNDVKPDIYRFAIRLNGIDCPELRSRNENEKKLAYKARDALSELIMDKYVKLENTSIDKYGRILADVYTTEHHTTNIHVNQWMIDNNHAVVYSGGTKPDWNKLLG